MIIDTIDLFNKQEKKVPRTEYLCIALGMNRLTFNLREMMRQEMIKITFKKIQDGKNNHGQI